MRQVLLGIALALVAAGCATTPPASPTTIPDPNPSNNLPAIGDNPQVVYTQFGDDPVSITLPYDWQVLNTDTGVILAERDHTIHQANVLDGVLIRIFRPQVDPAYLPESNNNALALLEYIVANPHLVNYAPIIKPQAFEWGEQPAAFYTLVGDDTLVTLVIAVALPDDSLLVYNVTIPSDQLRHVHAKLNTMPHSVTIGGVTLNASDLRVLPDPFPLPDAPAMQQQIASENTPEG